jgi:hypothetical protein
MADDDRQGKSLTSRLVALTPILTGVLAVWNVMIQQQLNRADREIKAAAQALEARRDRVARLTFVHERLLPDLLAQDAQRRNMTIELLRLTIPEDADKLFAGFRTSADSALREVGANGATAAANDSAALLVAQLIGPSKDARIAAYAELEKGYSGSTAAITYALDALSPPRLLACRPTAA